MDVPRQIGENFYRKHLDCFLRELTRSKEGDGFTRESILDMIWQLQAWHTLQKTWDLEYGEGLALSADLIMLFASENARNTLHRLGWQLFSFNLRLMRDYWRDVCPKQTKNMQASIQALGVNHIMHISQSDLDYLAVLTDLPIVSSSVVFPMPELTDGGRSRWLLDGSRTLR
jgi:hypothetical protein